MSNHFYDNGLHFECQKCLYCCSTEPGYVFLRESDLLRLSSSFNISQDEFILKYTRFVDYGEYYLVSLKERENYDCIFLSKNGCLVYQNRPVQCSTYPFWKEVLESKSSWNREGEYCPGIGKGGILSKEEIDGELKKNDEELYRIYKK